MLFANFFFKKKKQVNITMVLRTYCNGVLVMVAVNCLFAYKVMFYGTWDSSRQFAPFASDRETFVPAPPSVPALLPRPHPECDCCKALLAALTRRGVQFEKNNRNYSPKRIMMGCVVDSKLK